MWCVNDKFPNNVCRLCANISDVLIPIFGADKERIDVKIKKCCLPVEVTEDDLKPKSICLDCASKLEIFTELIELCLAADAKFETILQNANSNQKAVETVLSQGDEEQVEDEAVKMATMSEAGIESLLAEQEKEQEQDEEQQDEQPAGTQNEWVPEVSSHTNPLNVQPDSGVLVLSKVDGSVGHGEHILVMVELSSTCDQTAQQLSFSPPRYHMQNTMDKALHHDCGENNQQAPVMYNMNMQHISSSGKTFSSSFGANSQNVSPAKGNIFNCSDSGRQSGLTQVQVLTFASGKDTVSAAGPAHLYAAQPMTSVSKSEALVNLVQSEGTLFKVESDAHRDDQPAKVDLSSDGVAVVSSDTVPTNSACSVPDCDTTSCSPSVSTAPETGSTASMVPDSVDTQIMPSISSEMSIEIPTSSEAVSAMNCDESQDVPTIATSVLATASSVTMTEELGDDLGTNTSDNLCLSVDVSDTISETASVVPADISVSLPPQISATHCASISNVMNNCTSSTSIHLEVDRHHATCKIPRNKSSGTSNAVHTNMAHTVHTDTQCDILTELSGEKQDMSGGVCTVVSKSAAGTASHLMPNTVTALPASMDTPEDAATVSCTTSSVIATNAGTIQSSITDTFPVTESALLTEILLLPRPQQETIVKPLQASSRLPRSKSVSPRSTPRGPFTALQPGAPSQPACSVESSAVTSGVCRTNFSTVSLAAPSNIPTPLPPPSVPISVQTASSSVTASSIADPHTVFIATAAVPVTKSASVSAIGSTEFQNGATEILFIEEEDQTLAAALALTPIIEYRETDSEDNENTSSRGGKFHCEMCERTFKRRTKLKEHMAVHRQERPYECDQCEKKFFQRWDLTLHKRIHTGLFQCEFCNKTFPVRGKLERHRRTHTGEKPFVCSTCGKAFSDMRNLQSHRSTHSDERPHACDTCGRAFRVRSHLIDHYKVHSKDTPFSCDTCGKSFKWKTNLNIHRKVHTGERFPCNLCGNEYIRRADLTKHRRSHTPASLTDTTAETEEGTHPEGNSQSSASCGYACTVCCKSYSDQTTLQKHLRSHSEHCPFVCDICGKGFHFHWYLSSHKKVHLDSKTYTCRTCGKSFAKKNYFLSHTKCHTEQGL